ncbi:unnamed protein product [Bursaphelenchus okinawaensis]|uniref:G-protein coupled receptors family 1 profile domain-containing protein n=1 Tax=Bursaphelenchus okinawaensis TaxID=465554 RepID=A0A811K8J3_9BILA|nr:unnamed protein product [Bursaphelenchus okinawaensis]CAG9096152.1 unnamed protein product [Bursaphelenchus okinawaensis]
MDEVYLLATTSQESAETEYYEEEGDPCEISFAPARRWWLVAVAGTSLSVISLITNMIIARVLLQKKHSHFFFLGLLAVSDTFLSFCYGPVIAMEIVRYNVEVWITRLWWHYVGPLLSLCHVSMTFSCFMIILATIERYLITVKHRMLTCFRMNRCNLALLMFLLSLILRGTAVFEFQIVKNGNCTGIMEYDVALTDLVNVWVYGTVFRFYLRTIFTVLVPFFLLMSLNIMIVQKLQRQSRSHSMFRFGKSDHKQKIRSATRLLVFIVMGYLIANTLNVAITAWEFIDFESTGGWYNLYETLTDIISMLYVLTCATRIIVYSICNEEIRNALKEFLCSRNKKNVSRSHDYKPIQKVNPGSDKDFYEDSNIQNSQDLSMPNMGTEFDRVAIAMVIAHKRRDRLNSAPQLQFHKTMDSQPSGLMTSRSFIISNPLAHNGHINNTTGNSGNLLDVPS